MCKKKKINSLVGCLLASIQFQQNEQFNFTNYGTLKCVYDGVWGDVKEVTRP